MTGWHRDHARKAPRTAWRPKMLKARAPRPTRYGTKVVAALILLLGDAGGHLHSSSSRPPGCGRAARPPPSRGVSRTPGRRTPAGRSTWPVVSTVDLQPTVVAADARHVSSVAVQLHEDGRTRFRERTQIGRSDEREGFWSGSLWPIGTTVRCSAIERNWVVDDALAALRASINEFRYPADTFRRPDGGAEIAVPRSGEALYKPSRPPCGRIPRRQGDRTLVAGALSGPRNSRWTARRSGSSLPSSTRTESVAVYSTPMTRHGPDLFSSSQKFLKDQLDCRSRVSAKVCLATCSAASHARVDM
jgi:hypothetical protein